MRSKSKPHATLGGALRAARLKIIPKVTQAQLAEAANVSVPFISALENNRETSAAPETISRFAARLGVDPQPLLKLAMPKSARRWQDAMRKSA